MSRHTFALSVLLCSLASLMLLTPARGQSMLGTSPASSFAHQGFYCIFDYDFYDYSDYDYNDYSYQVSRPARDAEVVSGSQSALHNFDSYTYDGCYEGGCYDGGIPTDAPSQVMPQVESDPTPQTVSSVQETMNYGCAGYCYDDYDLYGYEYGESYDSIEDDGDNGDVLCGDVLCGDVLCGDVLADESQSLDASRVSRGLTADHDPLYDEAVYGVQTEAGVVEVAANDDCETFHWGGAKSQTVTEIDPAMQRIIEESASDIVTMIEALADRIAATRPAGPTLFHATARLLASKPDAVLPNPAWGLPGTVMVSVGMVSSNLPMVNFSLSTSTQQRVLLETADTLEGAALTLSTAATRIRRLAQGNRVTWKGIPYRR